MPLRMHHPGITVGGKLVAAPIHNQRFLHLREQEMTAHGRLYGGSQQTVVASRVQTRDGGRRKPAKTIGLQPLLARRRLDAGADFMTEMQDVPPILLLRQRWVPRIHVAARLPWRRLPRTL